MEDKSGNDKQHLFDCTDTERVYYSDSGDTNNDDDNVLPYGEDIQYHKEVEVNEAYIEALDNYIGSKVVVPCKYFIPFLDQVKRSNRDALGKPVGKEHSIPILNTRIYEWEFPYDKVVENVFVIIIDNLIDQNDYQGWDTKILENIVVFRSDPDVAILTGEQSYTNVSVIQCPVITKKDQDVQVKWRYQITWVPLHIIKE